MNWFLWTLLSGAALAVFYYWNTQPIARSKDEVINILEAWLDEAVEHGEWDYFESCSIKDEELEKIRQRCVELSISPEFTVAPKIGAALNTRGKEEVRRMLMALKGSESENAV